MNEIASKCVEDIRTKLQSVASLAGKHLTVYSPEDLADVLKKGAKTPIVGVLYEGMRSITDPGPSVRVGGSAEIIIAIILITDKSYVSQAADAKTPSLALLDEIRSKIMGQKSPSQHRWRFIVEAAGDVTSGTVVWVQRWASPVQLYPTS